MTELARRDDENRTALVEQAYKLYLDGHSFESIGERIGRHRNTVSKYVHEYADALDPGSLHFQREVSRAKLRKVQRYILDLLENGDIKDSSLTRPQLLHQFIEAEKEINRISGLHISRVEHNHNSGTAADLIKRYAEEGYITLDDEGDVIEDADYEIIPD